MEPQMRCAKTNYGALDRITGASIGPWPSYLCNILTRLQRMLLNHALLNAQAAASPPKGLLGLFGSPPKTWLRRGNSYTNHSDKPKSSSKATATDGTNSPQKQQSPPKTLPVPDVTPASSPAKKRPQPSPGGESHASGSAGPSPSKSPSRIRSTPAWASLYSLDVSLEEKGSKAGGKGA